MFLFPRERKERKIFKVDFSKKRKKIYINYHTYKLSWKLKF